MNEIKWQEPPPARRGTKSRKWTTIFHQLRKRPGEWALVDSTTTTTTATQIKHGALGGAKPGEFEATSRKNTAGKLDIYARYVGGDDA